MAKRAGPSDKARTAGAGKPAVAPRATSPRRRQPQPGANRRALWALLTRSLPGAPDDEVELALMFFLQQLELLANAGRFVWSGPLGQDRSRGLTIFEARDEAQARDTVAGFSPIQRRVWEVEFLAPWEVDLQERGG
ncbi:MAG: hypothetical protein HY330_01115 [Chloroflexi bacterium]|nr:hypothetical protein [Chloroflexota bacterium]